MPDEVFIHSMAENLMTLEFSGTNILRRLRERGREGAT
jgi:hypothetical protein